eukprot:snap_masked-scaffold_28-processed-gene-2.30-mRNA-1 protein AED:1.00 eAED:1.00 QI:0/0/0/0/1/1/6/0/145
MKRFKRNNRSIKQQYKNRQKNDSFEIIWNYDEVHEWKQPKKFKKEIELLFQFSLTYCPIYVLEELFINLILMFPNLKEIGIHWSTLNSENFSFFSNLQVSHDLSKVTIGNCKFLDNVSLGNFLRVEHNLKTLSKTSFMTLIYLIY